MNAGQQLYQRAKTLIPGGTQLLSKRPEMFLPEGWPAYYARARGIEVWDLDGRRYQDFAHMGVGACTLGYADEAVNEAVYAAMQNGSMCTLNAPDEVALAERLIAINPWAQKVRFAKTGGEACAIAIRIARAASGKSRVAFCGYHGWHDWYVSSNLADESHLDDQLLPGLHARGVPRELAHTAIPFAYNALEQLESIAAEYGDRLGVIFMEPQRGSAPEPGFLEGVRRIADRLGAVLVFDEITSGFRMNVGGIHALSGVEPDIALYGKALGNGYPIAAVIGRESIMEAAQETFISSTFWTESTGFAAALKTLKLMEARRTPEHLVALGERITQGWKTAAHRVGLTLNTGGIPPLTHLDFPGEDATAAMTYFTQEMLLRGYLAGSSVYVSQAHDEASVDAYLEAAEEVFAQIVQAREANDLHSRLLGPVKHTGFARLNA